VALAKITFQFGIIIYFRYSPSNVLVAYFLTVHLMKFTEPHIMWGEMTELLSNYELQSMWNEEVVALFEEALLTKYLSEE
jgi:hypothetical protein